MNWTEVEAEAAVEAMFPGCRASVVDGCEHHASGIVENSQGRSIASFRLYYGDCLFADEIGPVREIRIGQVGQYCGTPQEIRRFGGLHPEFSDDNDSAPRTIRVDLEVSRCRRYTSDDFIEVWGHVGDYEVCLPIGADDDRLRSLICNDESTTDE